MKPFELFLFGVLPGLACASTAVNVTIFAQGDCAPVNQRGFLTLNFDDTQAFVDNCYNVQDIGSTLTSNTNFTQCQTTVWAGSGCSDGATPIPGSDFPFGTKFLAPGHPYCTKQEYSSIRVTCLADAFPSGLAETVWDYIQAGNAPQAVAFPA